MNSIEKQLNISLSISLLIIFIVFWLISVFSIHHLTENYVLDRLKNDNESIIKHLEIPPQQLKADLNSLSPIYSRVNSGYYFVVKSQNNQIMSPSLQNYPLYLKPIKHSPEVYETLGPNKQLVLVRAVTATVKGHTVQIYVAEDHSPIQHTIRVFDIIIALLTLISLSTLYLIQRHIVQKGFRMLHPINDALQGLHHGKAVKLEETDYPTEIAPLITSLNQAISSATIQLEKSRQSNANLAHNLKTPLNIIYQLADKPELNAFPELREAINEQAEKILRLIERELKGARLASDMVSITPFELQQDLTDLEKSFQQLYPAIQLTLKLDKTLPPSLPIEKEDGYELLGNLLDNACKYAHSTVLVTVSNQDKIIQITIEDDGKGVSPSYLKHIQLRGFRLDESQPGHGIGLSIVKQIVSAYKANLQFSASQLGGVKVTLQLNK